MKKIKSHFWYNKSQRNGIFLLVLLIILLQSLYVFVDFSAENIIAINSPEILTFQKKIDSLKKEEIVKRIPKKYPFNPNYITDFKGYQLGMNTQEIDRLHAYRKLNKFVNSTKEFQKITKISDSLLSEISPLFKFPDWVHKSNKLSKKQKKKLITGKLQAEKLVFKLSTTNINEATKEDFQNIHGVGEVLSERIIKYRKKLQGFSYQAQVYEVWGLKKSTANSILKTFKIYNKPNIQKKNINTIGFKELLKIPYINYKLCKNILDYRDEIAEFQDILELKNIDGFPVDKYDRIVLYLKTE